MKIALRRYLLSPSRLRQVDPNRETFETFLTLEVAPLFALREAAVVRFRRTRWLAKQEKGALPLTWQEVSETFTRKRPRAGLETTLARELPTVLTQVFDRLRKVLRREREPQSVGRVEQLDAACLRWLTRQPGYTVAQKAGPRQQVLAVVRRENYDILENRVLRDLLLRTMRLTERWLEENENDFPNHESVKAVKRLGNLCRKGLELEILQGVSPLHDVPKPNYVLTQDALYRRIWDAYLLVVEHYRLIEGLWDKKDELADSLKQWQKDAEKYGDSFYRSELWVCPIKNNKPWVEDYPKFRVQDKACSPYWEHSESGHVTIDLLGLHLSDVLLMPDDCHPNAKPRLIDFNSPYVDFSPEDEPKNRQRGKYLLDILHDHDQEGLTAYFEQLYGVIGGADWTILVADNWEPEWLEAIKQAASAAIGSSNVFLLWRTIAYALGVNDCAPEVSVPRLNKQADTDCATFEYDEEGLPCHRAYRFHTNDFRIPKLPKRPITKSLFDWLWKCPTRRHTLTNNLLESGVLRFWERREANKAPYWDELMGLYMVYQTPSEHIELRTLVEYNEYFAGGSTYIGTAKQEFHLKGASGMRLYLLEWPYPARDRDLSLFACKLKEIAGNEQIWMLAKATPGQGVVKLELNHPSLNHPKTVALAGLTQTNKTATILEGEMDRSFPPISPKVIANGNLLTWSQQESVRAFAQGLIPSLDGGLFYQVRYLYPLGKLPPNMSKLEYLRRVNVFGAEEGHQYPNLNRYSLFNHDEIDFNALFRRLNDCAKREIRLDIYNQALRLIAWTYQYNNSLFIPLRKRCVEFVHKEQKSDPELITFCANLCNKPSEWSELFSSCMAFFKNGGSGCAERQRLLYNLLMFNENFITALHLHLPKRQKDVTFLVYVLCNTSETAKGDVQRNSCLRSLLYLLRIRLFDGKRFAMPGIDDINYNRIAAVCQKGKFWPGDGKLTKSYREVLRHYLNGNGRIDEIPQQN